MTKTNLAISIVVVTIVSSLIGVALYQQLDISRLYEKNRELEESNLQKDKEASSLRTYHKEQLANLSSTCAQLNSKLQELLRAKCDVTSLLDAPIYFDRSIYYPDAKAFWDSNTLVPIEVTVVQQNASMDIVKVRVSSSSDSKEMILGKTGSGVFKGTISAVGLRPNESVSNTSNFNVRYGDVIVAHYYDASTGNPALTAALFAFPAYIMSNDACVSFEPWKLVDSEGIPLVDYGSLTGIQYNPTIICGYALANYYMYVTTGNSTFRQTFLTLANWLARSAEQKGDFSIWEYKFDWPWRTYNATNPFASALAQGEGLSVLTRAYVLTGNKTYLDVAQKAMFSFDVEMSLGGVRYTDSDGVWYEEIADIGARSGKVLNGFIGALCGLYEYWFETNSSKAYSLFLEGTRTLSLNLHLYDTGSWSYYDLLNYNSASLSYHKTHINQLRIVYEITGLEILLVYSNKFQSYIH